jgi:septal ring factor EnvC (AmiA/AmiB activator)
MFWTDMLNLNPDIKPFVLRMNASVFFKSMFNRITFMRPLQNLEYEETTVSGNEKQTKFKLFNLSAAGTQAVLCNRFCKSLFVLFLFSSLAVSQTRNRDFNKEMNYQSQAVRDLKNEIAATRKKLQSEEKKEKYAARTIMNIEEEISLVERLINQIKKEEKDTRNQISILEEKISANEKELRELRLRYAKRAKYLYKKGSLSDIEKVLSSTSWRQAVYRTKYQKIIADIDRNNKGRIHNLFIRIGKTKLDYEASLRRSIKLKNEREKQVKELRSKKIYKKRELEKIRNSKTELAQYIKEKEKGVKQLEELMKKIREDKLRADRAERIRRQNEALKSKSFASLKGQLPWPAEGRVISKFGRKWNPELKTTTNNTGIDIKGKPGSPISTIMGGIVTTITFIRGYGNIIIIDHGGNFFTIYSHITNIQTNVDSEVRSGDIIAYMSDSGSINGAKLHFEIWGKDQKLDPEKWLVKK